VTRLPQILASPIQLLITYLKRAWLSGVLSTIATNIAIQGLGVVTGLIVARSLGPQGRGEVALVMLWPMLLASLGALGVPQAVTSFVAQHPNRASAALGAGLSLAGLQSVVCLAIGVFGLPLLLAHEHALIVTLSLRFLFLIPLNLSTLVSLGLLQGQLKLKGYNLLRLSMSLFYTAGLIALRAAHAVSVEHIIDILLLCNALTTALSLTAALRSSSKILQAPRAVCRDLLRFGIRIQGSNVSPMINQRLDQLLISVMMTPLQLGLYSVALTTSSACDPLASAFAAVIFPKAAQRAASGRGLSQILRIVANCSALIALLGLAMFCAVPSLIRACFGLSFMGAVGPCQILTVASVLRAVRSVICAALSGFNRPLSSSVSEGIALGLSAAALPFLLGSRGIAGAAIGATIGNGTALIYAGFSLYHFASIRTPLSKTVVSVES
jgi:O-antigen/teichoic acid export membrane protein